VYFICFILILYIVTIIVVTMPCMGPWLE